MSEFRVFTNHSVNITEITVALRPGRHNSLGGISCVVLTWVLNLMIDFRVCMSHFTCWSAGVNSEESQFVANVEFSMPLSFLHNFVEGFLAAAAPSPCQF